MKKTAIISTVAIVALAVTAVAFILNGNTGANVPSENSVEVSESNKVFNHFNVQIVPDLSNRTNRDEKPKPLSDLVIINDIVDRINPDFIKNQNRRVEQKDRFQISFSNQSLISTHNIDQSKLQIRFDQFDKQLNRIEYITGKASRTLDQDIASFKAEINRTYEAVSTSPKGADIWNYFNKLNELQVQTGALKPVKGPKGIVVDQEFKNVMVLLTDGYIEAAKFPKSKVCNSLSEGRVKKFRSTFRSEGKGRSVEQFFEEEGYGITPIDNPVLKNLNVIVLELDDRSLNDDGNATVQPTDAQIIELFWTDWLTKSGVNEFELHQTASSIDEVRQGLNRFMGIERGVVR